MWLTQQVFDAHLDGQAQQRLGQRRVRERLRKEPDHGGLEARAREGADEPEHGLLGDGVHLAPRVAGDDREAGLDSVGAGHDADERVRGRLRERTRKKKGDAKETTTAAAEEEEEEEEEKDNIKLSATTLRRIQK